MIVWFLDRCGLKYSILFSVIFLGVVGLFGSVGGVVGIGLNSCCVCCCRLVCDYVGVVSRVLSESDVRRWIGCMV